MAGGLIVTCVGGEVLSITVVEEFSGGVIHPTRVRVPKRGTSSAAVDLNFIVLVTIIPRLLDIESRSRSVLKRAHLGSVHLA